MNPFFSDSLIWATVLILLIGAWWVFRKPPKRLRNMETERVHLPFFMRLDDEWALNFWMALGMIFFMLVMAWGLEWAMKHPKP